jgi:hypothetical protein
VNLKPGERYVYQDIEKYGSLLKDTGRYTVKANIVGATFKDGSKIAFTSEWADKLSE